ncbi:MAG: hypothetical protein RL477_46 [Pseudomonadota bacterium]
MTQSGLISDEYRQMQERLHLDPDYGIASRYFAATIAQVIKANDIKELLDYGAGKGRLGETLKELGVCPAALHHYDPAIPGWSAPPAPAELTVCLDVLEHIEPDRIDNVLDDLRRVTRRLGVFSVSTTPADKTLDDGRNAHLIVQGSGWWLRKLLDRFELIKFEKIRDGFIVAVAPIDSSNNS